MASAEQAGNIGANPERLSTAWDDLPWGNADYEPKAGPESLESIPGYVKIPKIISIQPEYRIDSDWS